jgi:hypothetical protein
MNLCRDLSGTAYQGASKSLAQTIANLSQELRRSAKEITPVALNTGEVFDILRRRLFEKLPDAKVIGDVADAYAKSLDEAVRSRMVAKTPDWADRQLALDSRPPSSTPAALGWTANT